MSDTLISASNRVVDRCYRFLDQINEQFHRDPLAASSTMTTLLQGLHEVRSETPREEWQNFCKKVTQHDLYQLIQQDPFTNHSTVKPRGYAGDAQLLDFIYGHRQTPTTPMGSRIFDFMIADSPACRAVRARAKKIAEIIDRLANQKGSIKVLSIACGHLREADMSQAFQQGNDQ
jgi:hypothetical protein